MEHAVLCYEMLQKTNLKQQYLKLAYGARCAPLRNVTKTNLKLNFKLHKFKTVILKISLWSTLCSATRCYKEVIRY